MDTSIQKSNDSARPALVLGGGGAYGVVQAAYVHAATEAGFQPQLVVGTSVGALNGAWVALHPEGSAELLRIWLGLDRLRILQLNPLRLARKIVRTPMGICDNDIVPRLITDHLGGQQFTDVKLPLAIVATSLTRSCKHVFTSGSLEDAILASTAIPGVYDPIEIEGELFVDGCLTASVDLVTAVEMGATEILAIDLTPPPPTFRPRTAVGVLRQSLGILTHATTDAMEAAVARQLPVAVVRPDLARHSPWRLDDSASAVAHNLQLARRAIATVLDASGHVVRPEPRDGPLPQVQLPPAEPAPPVEFGRFFQRWRRAG
ncbi:MAG: patatin-like phospholipase family protein [Dehalococcoidia bacterium]